MQQSRGLWASVLVLVQSDSLGFVIETTAFGGREHSSAAVTIEHWVTVIQR
jgi:hypothetical protein